MKELLYLKDEQLKDLIEKLFIGYRETFSDSKEILDKYSIGLAHNKVIHLLSMYQGISISQLLKKLKVTKQSLNRILKDLIKLDVISFEKDKKDSRLKHVLLNEKGQKLFSRHTHFKSAVLFRHIPRNLGLKVFNIAGKSVMLVKKLTATARRTIPPNRTKGTTSETMRVPNPKPIAKKLKSSARPVFGYNANITSSIFFLFCESCLTLSIV